MRNSVAGRTLTMAVALALALGAGSVAAQNVLFEDRFQQPDGSRPASTRWVLAGKQDEGFWTISRNMLATGPGDRYPIGPTTAIANAPGAFQWTNYTVSARFTVLDSDGSGEVLLIARASGNNMYLASFGMESGRRSVRIKKSQNGVDVEMAAAIHGQGGVNLPDFGRAGSGPFLAELQVIGDEVTVFLEGQRVLSWRDTRNPFPAGSAGVGQYLSNAVFSDFRVVEGPSQSAAAGTGTQPAAGVGAGIHYRIATLPGLTREDAERAAQQYREDNQPDVEVLPDPEGYTVYIGKFATRPEAERLFEKLDSEGVIVSAVVQINPQELAARPQQEAGNIRVELGRFRDQAQALQLRQRALVDAFYPVEIRQDGNDWVVYAGRALREMADGERAAVEARGRGYANARAVRSELAAASASAGVPTQGQIEEALREIAGSAGQSDLAAVRSLVEQQLKAAEQGGLSPAERERLQRADEQARAQAAQVVEVLALRQQLDSMANEAMSLINQRRFDEAQKVVAEIRALRPAETSIQMLTEMIELRRGGGQVARPADGGDAAVERLRQLLATATRAEQDAMATTDLAAREEALRRADELWSQLQSQSTNPGEQRTAGQRLAAIRAERDRVRQQLAEQAKASQRSRLIMIIGGVAAAIAVAGGAFFVMLRRQKATPAAPAAPRPAAGLGIPAPSGGPTGALAGAGILAGAPAGAGIFGDPVGASPTSPTTPTPNPSVRPSQSPATESSSVVAIPGLTGGHAPAGGNTPLPTVGQDDDRIRPGVMVPAVTVEGMVPVDPARTPSSAAVPLPQIASITPVPETAGATPGSGVHERPTTMVDVSAISPVPSSAQVAVPSAASFQTPLPIARPGANAQGMGFLFEQSFDDEVVGQAPRGWKGQYDYATLAVAPRDPANPAAGNCMRFEKKTGAGAAYYALKFPDASGRIALEFDLRCDDKNRYLIGFYIEKDEDFRQAISTIVHRPSTTAPPTLRLQGESHPYEFTRWVRIRFIIDLPRNLVDGWVDDISVAAGVRLNQAPKVLNTLSIRDNSATTGILMIDNIRVYRAP